jgi:hypothetical protein
MIILEVGISFDPRAGTRSVSHNRGLIGFYQSMEVLQRDLDEWLRYRTQERPHEDSRSIAKSIDESIKRRLTQRTAGKLRVQLATLNRIRLMKFVTAAVRIKRPRKG